MMIEAALHAARAAPTLGRVWPGYWSPDQAVILYQPAKAALLITAVTPPQPFRAVAAELLPPALHGRAFLACGPLPGLTGNFDTAYPVGGQRTIAVKLEQSAYETLEVLFHEGFHEWQKTAFARTAGADSISLLQEVRGYLDLTRDPRFVASMELERRILAAAVEAGSSQQRAELARLYLAVKARRTRSMPVEARHTELNVERKEGAASIVGHEAAALAYGRPADQTYPQLRMFMAEPPQSLPAGDSAYARFRMRAFGAGAAMAWILSRMGVDWKTQLQSGQSFEALLQDAVQFRAAGGERLAARAARRFGHRQLLRDAEAWRANNREVTASDFYRVRPYRLTVEFSGFGGQVPSYQVAHGDLASVPEKNLLIFIDTRSAQLDYGPIKLRSEERPILVDQRGGPALYSFSLMMNELPEATGFGPGTGGKIVAQGLEIDIAAPATISRTDTAMTIRVSAAAPAPAS